MNNNEIKLWHIAISVSNIDKSIYFYKKVFGFNCTKRFYIESLGAEACFLENGNFVIEVFNFMDFKPLPDFKKSLLTDLKVLGVKHFAFKVKNIQKTYEYIKNLKVEIATNITVGGSGLRYFFIKDPDGILIELIEKKGKI